MMVAFRVDASTKIGTGHVMRCLTLAEELRKRNCKVRFICRAHPGHMADKISSKGFQLSLLPAPNEAYEVASGQNDYADWLGVKQEEDARQTLKALENKNPDWLIVDHYSLDARWEKTLRKYADQIMVVDDLANREHDCDLLLDQNYFREPEKRYKGFLPEHCDTLLCPKYALLRPAFCQARKFCRMRGNVISRVLVYFGGNDPDNLTGLALEALSDKNLNHLLVDAVIGPNNPHQEKLENLVEQRPGTRLHVQPENFTELMLRADLCIGAGGTTTWERLCLGLPSLVITVAENQEEFTKDLDKDGYVKWLGRKQDVSLAKIKSCLQAEVDKPQSDELFSNSPLPVDGLGVMRVAEKIIPTSRDELFLRQACVDDIELFYFWVNDPAVRENSFNQEPIFWQDHVNWFKKKLESNLSQIWVMQTPYGLPVGQIRFDINEGVANIDYSLDPMVRGRGWGQILFQMGLTEFKRLHQNIPCQGRVKAENHPSRHCFQSLGFIEESNRGGDSVFYWL